MLAAQLLLPGCGDAGHVHGPDGHSHDEAAEHHDGPRDEGHSDDGDNTGSGDHADGGDHDGADDHAHDEQPLGTLQLGDLAIDLAQGHGPLVAGEESHLVVALPYSDDGATTIRAWIGSEDRTLSYVGKGTYAADHDDYDIHATAPDPLPAGALWWIELERPDGQLLLGSAAPILE